MTTHVPVLRLHPDRLLPPEPGVRSIARRLYAAVRDLPILSAHSHVDPRLLVDNEPFADPASLFVTPDHYVTRLLHASGVPLDALGVGRGPLAEAEARQVWRLLCDHWYAYRGTSVRWWLEAELAEIFEVSLRPSAESADAIYDQVAERLALDSYRPRALYERFRIQVLATTDDPADDLSAHAALAADPTFTGRVVPTFRPDRYLELAEAERIYGAALAGEATEPESAALRRHLLLEMARMSCDDGLVMTLHPGVRRGHHGPTTETFGADVGADIPIRAEFTDALRPLLERYGTQKSFHLVVFTLDETVFSRELAPL